MASIVNRQGRKRLFCGHCNEYLSKTHFYAHKRLYYDSILRKWSSERVVHPLVIQDNDADIQTDFCDHSRSTPGTESNDQPDFLTTQDFEQDLSPPPSSTSINEVNPV